MSDQQLIYFNGVNITTGEYLTAPMTMDTFAAACQQQRAQIPPPLRLAATAAVGGVAGALPSMPTAAHPPTVAPLPTAGPNFDPTKLEEAGWGVIFAQNPDPAVYNALRPLLDLRKAQASRLKPQRYKEYLGSEGWQPRERAAHFLRRHGATPGEVNPDEVPYYLLLVADPLSIVYGSQANLDIQRGVGRLHFETPEEYASYAQAVIAAETGHRAGSRRAVLFAPTTDQNTQMSCKELAIPLASALKAGRPAWQVDSITADDATKARLGQLLGGGDPAALVFTASHGGFTPIGDPVQLKRQGCLICQGFDVSKKPSASYNPADFFFTGGDIADTAQIPPMITFHFACFGAGTPEHDQFTLNEPAPKQGGPASQKLARKPFVACLPKRLLGHPNGGALATIGHIERAWGFTFHTEHNNDDIATFQSAMQAIMDGKPVGCAMQSFGKRYSELRTELAGVKPPQGIKVSDEGTDGDFEPGFAGLTQVPAPQQISSDAYLALWTAARDARNYAIVGDPAVRLSFAAPQP